MSEDARALAPPTRLPPLPLDEWRPTKDTLHLYAQVVGKLRLATTPLRNHWWNVSLYVDVRGLTTRRMRHGDVKSLPLRDGLSVAQFHAGLLAMLADVGVEIAIRAEPFGVPMTTPFADDHEHAAYDADAVGRWWRIAAWSDWVLEGFAA